MLEGIDWVNDREWLRFMYLKWDWKYAQKLQRLNYPHFRTPRVIQTFSSDDD